MTVDDDIAKGLVNPPAQKMITTPDGTFVALVQLSDVMSPNYRRCVSCAARHRCSRVQKKGKTFLDVDCVIEKEQLEVLLTRLTFEGVTSQDELLVRILVRNAFVMTRLYELETVIDLQRILSDDEAMRTYKDLMGITNKAEAQHIKVLKELMATRKEDQKKTTHTTKGKNYDLSMKLSDKNASNNQ